MTRSFVGGGWDARHYPAVFQFGDDGRSTFIVLTDFTYWLNGAVFLFAVFATVLWLVRARHADASVDLLHRLKSDGS
jgi:hypothetical protein